MTTAQTATLEPWTSEDLAFCKEHGIDPSVLMTTRANLTVDELQYCASQKVSPAVYARNLARRRDRRNRRVI